MFSKEIDVGEVKLEAFGFDAEEYLQKILAEQVELEKQKQKEYQELEFKKQLKEFIKQQNGTETTIPE